MLLKLAVKGSTALDMRSRNAWNIGIVSSIKILASRLNLYGRPMFDHYYKNDLTKRKKKVRYTYWKSVILIEIGQYNLAGLLPVRVETG
jgi:hypothetical protein